MLTPVETGRVATTGIDDRVAMEAPRSIRVFLVEGVGAALWLAYWLCVWARLARGPSFGPVRIVLTIVFGILVSDFMSGFLHWLFDTFWESTTPYIGPILIAPFREHHIDPLAMTRHGFLELLGNSFLGFIPLMTIVWWFGPTTAKTNVGLFGYWFLQVFSFALTGTNQLHSWAHQPKPPRIALWLQACGLAVTSAHHQPHHVPPHRSTFCVTTGWFDLVADKTGFFQRLERLCVAMGIPRKVTESSYD